MVTKNTCNGYTNYETWNCALWLDNDQGTQGMMQEKAEELVTAIGDIHDADEIEKATEEMAGFIESMVDEMKEEAEPGASMFSDMLNASLREIDYQDIAQSRMADAINERKQEEKAA